MEDFDLSKSNKLFSLSPHWKVLWSNKSYIALVKFIAFLSLATQPKSNLMEIVFRC